LSIVPAAGRRMKDAAREADRGLVALCPRRLPQDRFPPATPIFSQTERLDGWGCPAAASLLLWLRRGSETSRKSRENLPASAWASPGASRTVSRQDAAATPASQREGNRWSKAREFKNIVLVSEDVAEFDYRPSACRKELPDGGGAQETCRWEKGEQGTVSQTSVTSSTSPTSGAAQGTRVVYEANDRCNQENHIAQLKSGCRALHAPVDNLESNWAYMLMTALAWNLKAWWGAVLVSSARAVGQERPSEREGMGVLRLEFKSFVNAFVLLPCQIVRTSGKVVYRLLSWNPHLSIFFRLWDVVAVLSGQESEVGIRRSRSATALNSNHAEGREKRVSHQKNWASDQPVQKTPAPGGRRHSPGPIFFPPGRRSLRLFKD